MASTPVRDEDRDKQPNPPEGSTRPGAEGTGRLRATTRNIARERDRPRQIVRTNHPAEVQSLPAVGRVGIIVPAKNESQNLPACLVALAQAAIRVTVAVHVVVVLDDCTDASAQAVADIRDTLAQVVPGRFTPEALTVGFSNVGAARGFGADHLLARYVSKTLWLATTDADSVVPANWLSAQLACADAGVDAVAGTIAVHDWQDRPLKVIEQATADYVHPAGAMSRPNGGHRHVHGANLGVRADAYLGAGKFPAYPVHEDVALVTALEAAGRRIAWVSDMPVTTSARRHARSPGGFAAYLDALEQPTAAAPSFTWQTEGAESVQNLSTMDV